MRSPNQAASCSSRMSAPRSGATRQVCCRRQGSQNLLGFGHDLANRSAFGSTMSRDADATLTMLSVIARKPHTAIGTMALVVEDPVNLEKLDPNTLRNKARSKLEIADRLAKEGLTCRACSGHRG